MATASAPRPVTRRVPPKRSSSFNHLNNEDSPASSSSPSGPPRPTNITYISTDPSTISSSSSNIVKLPPQSLAYPTAPSLLPSELQDPPPTYTPDTKLHPTTLIPAYNHSHPGLQTSLTSPRVRTALSPRIPTAPPDPTETTTTAWSLPSPTAPTKQHLPQTRICRIFPSRTLCITSIVCLLLLVSLVTGILVFILLPHVPTALVAYRPGLTSSTSSSSTGGERTANYTVPIRLDAGVNHVDVTVTALTVSLYAGEKRVGGGGKEGNVDVSVGGTVGVSVPVSVAWDGTDDGSGWAPCGDGKVPSVTVRYEVRVGIKVFGMSGTSGGAVDLPCPGWTGGQGTGSPTTTAGAEATGAH